MAETRKLPAAVEKQHHAQATEEAVAHVKKAVALHAKHKPGAPPPTTEQKQGMFNSVYDKAKGRLKAEHFAKVAQLDMAAVKAADKELAGFEKKPAAEQHAIEEQRLGMAREVAAGPKGAAHSTSTPGMSGETEMGRKLREAGVTGSSAPAAAPTAEEKKPARAPRQKKDKDVVHPNSLAAQGAAKFQANQAAASAPAPAAPLSKNMAAQVSIERLKNEKNPSEALPARPSYSISPGEQLRPGIKAAARTTQGVGASMRPSAPVTPVQSSTSPRLTNRTAAPTPAPQAPAVASAPATTRTPQEKSAASLALASSLNAGRPTELTSGYVGDIGSPQRMKDYRYIKGSKEAESYRKSPVEGEAKLQARLASKPNPYTGKTGLEPMSVAEYTAAKNAPAPAQAPAPSPAPAATPAPSSAPSTGAATAVPAAPAPAPQRKSAPAAQPPVVSGTPTPPAGGVSGRAPHAVATSQQMAQAQGPSVSPVAAPSMPQAQGASAAPSPQAKAPAMSPSSGSTGGTGGGKGTSAPSAPRGSTPGAAGGGIVSGSHSINIGGGGIVHGGIHQYQNTYNVHYGTGNIGNVGGGGGAGGGGRTPATPKPAKEEEGHGFDIALTTPTSSESLQGAIKSMTGQTSPLGKKHGDTSTAPGKLQQSVSSTSGGAQTPIGKSSRSGKKSSVATGTGSQTAKSTP